LCPGCAWGFRSTTRREDRRSGSSGGGSSTIDVNSNSSSIIDSFSTSQIDAKSNSTAQLHIVGLDHIRVKSDANSDSKNDVRLAITEPIVTHSKMEMDLKPVQAEFCLKLGLERFPSTKGV
jgi:hypothetical protein